MATLRTLVGAAALATACDTSAHSSPVVSDLRIETRFASYLGGSGKESARDVAADTAGNLYMTGGTETESFPTTEGAHDREHNGWQDVWVAKFSPSGELLWCTLLGGTGYDRAYAIEVGPDGSVYVGGRAGPGFPTTPGTVQPEFGGDDKPSGTYGEQDGFVARLSPDGSELVWATYLGVSDGSNLRDMTVGGDGAVYVATGAAKDYPSPYTTDGAFQTELRGRRDSLVLKLAPDGTRVLWGTYIGGSDRDGGACSIQVDASGSAYLLGHTFSDDLPVTEGAYQTELGGEKDLFLARLAPDGRSLLFLTYFGGSGGDNSETHGLTLAPDGSAYITATTRSTDLPQRARAKVAGYQVRHAGGATSAETGMQTNYPGDAFAARISSDGSELLGFTYFGGSSGEGLEGSGLDADGRLWISGGTYSDDLPVVKGAGQPRKAGDLDAFVACLSPDLSECLWSTYLGGAGLDVVRSLAVSSEGVVAGGGVTYSADLPVHGAAADGSYAAESDVLLWFLAPARPDGASGEDPLQNDPGSEQHGDATGPG